ncbi:MULTISPECIES: DNA polymerase III subunit delta' [Thermomonospora]|uniref:DNA polymerase III, delta prime subunit n=1 Tax=Thermomonospora curvata (strain ATCC 19995 / DSM 43183 / JCM 3096 / KCTC 9072 / NBRC 15933 / NCIMB 10081 / Henssen B9) TaxID=471852 RepID=D1A585_THECD|nr:MULTISPECIES: DNA polymerase III subunit delta' [Thermomonospora]ACZ00071.1 DNA polymerase III, delta prime subunit [Thermomonospora curvata DSM 43183]PKK11904.1 MAG: DNA polymerase III subunit delta' [Thermomonospora sp. CIF 1]
MSVWDDLVGQQAVAERLAAAAAAGARVLAGGERAAGGMTHAWLFTGPPGSGRAGAARAFAAALQCREDPPGCGHCPSCHQVLQGTHADVEVVRPEGLSYSVKEARELVLRASSAPTGGRWRIVLFEDADRSTEAAANALLKAIEEPPPRTVWLLCAPSPEDLVTTIRSRCRVVTLRTPPAAAIAEALIQRDGIDPKVAAEAARAAQGDLARARRLATDPEARRRRAEVLALPGRLNGLAQAVNAAAALVAAAEADAKAIAEELNETETAQMRRALGENDKGRMPRGTAGVLKELEKRQKSRASRVERDALDRALLDLAFYYRDVLALQLGSAVELVNGDREAELRALASAGTPEATLRRLEAIMECRRRLDANVQPLLAFEAMTMALRAG